MFTLLDLTYAPDALEPAISARTLSFHHGKHLKGYVDNLNKLIVGTEFEALCHSERSEESLLTAIVRKSTGAIFNNAGQILNHNLYFSQFAPASAARASVTAAPAARLIAKIEQQWGTLDAFKAEFVAKGVGLFGSGWVWLSSQPDGTHKPSWTFGPISIHPDYKRKGYGLRLLNHALDRAREMGVGFLCMEGNIDFYRHAGFDLACRYNIHYHDFPKEDEVPFFLAQELIPGWLRDNGIEEATYCPPKGYFVADENPEAFEAYESTFPPKEKLRLPGQLSYDGVMETGRIILRPWQDSDAAVLYRWASDPDVGPRAGWAPHKSVEESLEVIRTVFKDATNTWAIELKETGEAIGAMGYGPSCECNLPARDGEPLAGYWVAKPYWNQGICTEALGLMIEHIRATTDIKSLISGHFVDNPASGRVMEKCGFVPTGETVIDETQYQGAGRPIRVLRLQIR